MKIPYSQEREKSVAEHFANYPNGNNITAMWKLFWYISIENKGGKIGSITIKLMDATTVEHQLPTIQLNLQGYFKEWNVEWNVRVAGFPSIILKPKQDIDYKENFDIVDRATVKIVTEKELQNMNLNLI